MTYIKLGCKISIQGKQIAILFRMKICTD